MLVLRVICRLVEDRKLTECLVVDIRYLKHPESSSVMVASMFSINLSTVLIRLEAQMVLELKKYFFLSLNFDRFLHRFMDLLS